MNRLHAEKSPYLLQHKDNPVHWYAWGKEAFAVAVEENKPVFLSIGYSTCYWCHVMESDSFEQQAVADALNDGFISIKVDREERPDIDAIYMEAVQSMTGHGGWPMSVFLTPEKKPFYGGTFFYRDQFLQILSALKDAWISDRARIDETAEQLTSYLRERSLVSDSKIHLSEAIGRAVAEYEKSFDSAYGGFGGAPKFPPSMQLEFLLNHHALTGGEDSLIMVTKTLDSMAAGGLYDHLGGGFSRYSTDEKWIVPHFEKMLYDNALLGRVYLHAYLVTKDQTYLEVGCQTLDYVLRDMLSPEGAFYSAEDAGEVDREGEFYVWTESELQELLSPEEFEILQQVYTLPRGGNFEGKVILTLPEISHWMKKQHSVQSKLLTQRGKRVRPHRDEKILTSWNSLMISALAVGYQVSGDEKYLQAARNAAAFLRDHLHHEGLLFIRYKDGDARFKGNLDDYAYYIAALLDLYQSDLDSKWISLALELAEQVEERFLDSNQPGYFYSQSDDVLFRKKDLIDNALPSANGVMLKNLYRLFLLSGELKYRTRAERLLTAFSSLLERYPSALPSVLEVVAQQERGMLQLVVAGNSESFRTDPVIRSLQSSFSPQVIVSVADGSGINASLVSGKRILDEKTTYYVCREGSCQHPTTVPGQALELIEKST